ncbi:hemerythrin domain-containing protein [Stakelama tenebrarum]|uniref:Hemerythrin domain-containing protein n=1 Tax=Stakelama tenebrarum TaxID=2711215 RepID=A0A6G6Y4U2_9SPHN|nr:hemerythrin domain-containing protein [Sphingosinithalassobacter tenebrarum]QIG79623.1 hemerythrin domain-containing protein [Sphingosinithalassobacter tenebrarum]
MPTMERDSKGRFKGKAEGAGRHIGLISAAAAGGAAIGLMAMVGRKAAVQAPSALSGDWVKALENEHKAVFKLFDLIENTDERATTRRSLHLAQLKHALAKHDVEEGNVIYPALREAGMTEEADQLTREHGYIKQYLYELETMPYASPEWIAKLRKFRTDLEKHVAEEENTLFPKLYEQLSEEKNRKLGVTMNKEGFKVA